MTKAQAKSMAVKGMLKGKGKGKTSDGQGEGEGSLRPIFGSLRPIFVILFRDGVAHFLTASSLACGV